MKRIALFIAAAALMAVACEKTPTVEANITADVPEVLIPIAGSEDTPAIVKVTSTVDWTVTKSEESDWLFISPEKGKAGKDIEIELRALENKTNARRFCKLTFNAGNGNAYCEVMVNQACEAEIILASEEPLTFEAAGTEKTIKFSTNVAWESTASENWITLSPKDGQAANDIELKVTATANSEFKAREAEITITADNKTAKVKVTQDAAVLLEQTEFWTAQKGESGEFAVNASDFNVEVKDATENPWLTLVAEGRKVKYTAAPNNDFGYRSAAVEITSPTGAFDAATVYIFQNGRVATVWMNKPHEWTGFDRDKGARFGLLGDYIIAANGAKAYILDAKTGSVLKSSDMPSTLSADNVCIDDAGNILVAANAAGTEFTVLTGKSEADLANPKVLLTYNSANFSGATFTNLRVKGNIEKDAIITVYGGTGGIGYAIYWEVKDGVVSGPSYHNCPYETNVNCGVVLPVSTSIADGLWFGGYNGTGLNLYKGDSWTSVINTTSWDTNFNCMATATLNGKEYLAAVYGAFFSYTKPQIVVFDITDKSNVTLVGNYYVEYDYGTAGRWADNTAHSDIVMTGKDNALHIWFNDTAYGAAGYVTIAM